MYSTYWYLAKCKREEKAEAIENFQQNLTFSEFQSQLIFLPVYVCSYYYDSSEYIFVINAQTGSIRGQV
jgi:hypothetical protein